MRILLSGQHLEYISIIPLYCTKTTSEYANHLRDYLIAIACFS